MPRGQYPRKGKNYAAAAIEVAEAHQAKTAPPARACSRCVAFEEPAEPGPNGLCRFLPRAEIVRRDGWCVRGWKAREGA